MKSPMGFLLQVCNLSKWLGRLLWWKHASLNLLLIVIRWENYVPTSLQIKAQNPKSDNQRLQMVLCSIFWKQQLHFIILSIRWLANHNSLQLFAANHVLWAAIFHCTLVQKLTESHWQSFDVSHSFRFGQEKHPTSQQCYIKRVEKCGQIATIYIQYITLKVRWEKSCHLFLLILS